MSEQQIKEWRKIETWLRQQKQDRKIRRTEKSWAELFNA